ncbi:MAG: hypothetical protein GX162_05450 [Firmicutes bacterium]|nr:hypothetical protein [Bacillota bacterium]
MQPTHSARVRILLKQGKVAVYRNTHSRPFLSMPLTIPLSHICV